MRRKPYFSERPFSSKDILGVKHCKIIAVWSLESKGWKLEAFAGEWKKLNQVASLIYMG